MHVHVHTRTRTQGHACYVIYHSSWLVLTCSDPNAAVRRSEEGGLPTWPRHTPQGREYLELNVRVSLHRQEVDEGAGSGAKGKAEGGKDSTQIERYPLQSEWSPEATGAKEKLKRGKNVRGRGNVGEEAEWMVCRSGAGHDKGVREVDGGGYGRGARTAARGVLVLDDRPSSDRRHRRGSV